MSDTYVFRAVDAIGAPVRGEVDADSPNAVTEQLKARGLMVLDARRKASSKEIDLSLRSGVKPRDLTIMTRQLSTMITAGLTLLRALNVLEEQTESKKLKETLVDVRQRIESGASLSESLGAHPKVFDSLYVSMVKAGETGGFLESTLLRVADQLEASDSLRRKVRSAMVYPAVVITFALIVMFVLIGFIVPVFAGIFEENNGELPALTRVTMAMSDGLRGSWYVLFAVVGGVVFSFRKWKRSDAGRKQWDTMRLRTPMKIGPLVRKIALARWSRTLASLVRAGVPTMEAIDVTGRTSGNWVVEKAMRSVVEAVRSGGTIHGALRQEPVFPVMVTHMVSIGEETGALEDTLSKVADFYEDEVDAGIKALTSILEPIMIVFVGAIVGFVVISMYLPMFKVYDQIQ